MEQQKTPLGTWQAMAWLLLIGQSYGARSLCEIVGKANNRLM